jgi:hypothetical protein
MAWQDGIKTLIPNKFRNAPRVYEYLDAIGQWLDENAQTKLDGLLNLVDVRTVPDQYLQNLADCIGLTLNQSIASSDADLRHQIENAVDWYKIKGTYKAITVILYTVQLSANVYDLYSLDYKNFVRMYWFSLGVDDPTQFQVYPNSWVPGMYKTPHFDIEVELLLVFGTNPTWYLISGDQFAIAQALIEQVRPANTVPHYYAKVAGSASTNFLVNTVVSSQVSTVLIQANWQALVYTLDNNPLKYMDQGDIFDFTLDSFLQSWDVFQIGTGNIGVLPSPTATGLANPIFTGNINSIVINSNNVILTADVPASFATAGITEFGIFSSNGYILQVLVTTPSINKVNGYTLRYEITVNF